VGAFDGRFPGAYDDVVLCMRMADAGKRLVYHPTASILHHRRDSITGFLRQQNAWGAGVERFEELGPSPDAGEPEELLATKRGAALLSLDRGRMQHVFIGPQARQLFIRAESPLHVGLPAKALTAFLAAIAAGALPAWRLGRLRAWLGLGGAGLFALFATVAARVPVSAPRRGPAGLAQRAVTAALWFAQPFARRFGLKRESQLRSRR